MPDRQDILRFTGHRHLRHRLVLAILSGKSIRVADIRSDDVHVGLDDSEINLLRLLEKVTNGSTIDISVTGTSFVFHPGLLPGGTFNHACHPSRSIGWYLEALIPLSPFCKRAFQISLTGVTSTYPSVDTIRTVTLPHLHLFGINEGLDLKIQKRGSAPLGGGQVLFKCPIVRQLNTLKFLDCGQIQKIRGVAWSTRVSPQFANRMVDGARSILNGLVPDLYLYTDAFKGDEAGKSPGFGLTLVAQSTTTALHSAEDLGEVKVTPEDVGKRAACRLIENINRGGCIDSRHQWLVLLMMVLGKEDVGRCLIGSIIPESVQYLRDLQTYFGVRFKLSQSHTSRESRDEVDVPTQTVVSCTGIGYSNVNRGLA